MSSQDYYRLHNRATQLPSIRDVLPDQFEGNPYSFDAMGRALPQADSSTARPLRTGPTLPPMAGQHYARATGYNTPHSGTARGGSTAGHPQAPAPYSFDVFRPSSGGLVLASSSSRSQGILRSTRADAGKRHADDDDGIDDACKKYACPVCGKRFARPSSLKAHEVVHTEDKPHLCPYPGCGKSFSVASNMRRHYRKAHENNPGTDDEGEYPQQPQSQNYYFSRR